MSEKFSLKWNDFQTNVANSFRKLRNEDDFYDVTLVSDDRQQVSAHKIVLSASSEYFRTILKSNKHSHPMVCLNGVNSLDLKNIIEYIYNGEIQIYQEQLDQFLSMAQRFQLEGLIQGKEVNIGGEDENINDGEEEFERKAFKENEKMNLLLHKPKSMKPQKIFAVESFNAENLEELDKDINSMFERVGAIGSKRRCLQCGKISSNSTHAREHAETHIDGLSFPCQYCDKTLKSRHGIRNHMHSCHQTIRVHINRFHRHTNNK